MTFFIVTFCCAFVALGSFLFGYDAGIISSTIAQKAFVEKFGSESHLSDTVAGGIVSSFTGKYTSLARLAPCLYSLLSYC